MTVGPASSTYREGNATVMFMLDEGGVETIVNATTFDAVVKGESAPARLLLAELEGIGRPIANATTSGGGLERLKETEKQKDPIHLKKRGGKMRGSGLIQQA